MRTLRGCFVTSFLAMTGGGVIARSSKCDVASPWRTMARRLFVASLALATSAAVAQTYPDRPIRLVVAFAPGGGDQDALHERRRGSRREHAEGVRQIRVGRDFEVAQSGKSRRDQGGVLTATATRACVPRRCASTSRCRPRPASTSLRGFRAARPRPGP